MKTSIMQMEAKNPKAYALEELRIILLICINLHIQQLQGSCCLLHLGNPLSFHSLKVLLFSSSKDQEIRQVHKDECTYNYVCINYNFIFPHSWYS